MLTQRIRRFRLPSLALIGFLFLNIVYRATFRANQLQTTDNPFRISGTELIRRLKVGDLRLVVPYFQLLALISEYIYTNILSKITVHILYFNKNLNFSEFTIF